MTESQSIQQIKILCKYLNSGKERFIAYAFACTHNFHDAQDVYSKVLDIVIEKCLSDRFFKDDLSLNTDQIDYFVKNVIGNLAHEKFRERNKFVSLSDEVLGALFDDFRSRFRTNCEEQEYQSRMREALRECFMKLNRNAREVMSLKYANNATYDEIAEIISRSSNGVQGILRRSKKQLRQCINIRMSL